MFSKILSLALLTLAAAQSFPINITAPSPNTWLIANEFNTVAWTPCSGPVAMAHPLVTFIVNNPDPSVLIGNLSVLGAVPTTDCSKSFTPTNLPAGTDYTMFFVDATSNDVVAVSQKFDVKPQGSTYATSSSSSGTGNPTATDASGPQQSNASNSTGSATAKNGATSSLTQKTFAALAGVAVVAVALL